MIKIRIQGTEENINEFINIIKENQELMIMSQSRPYGNVGTNKYYRVYLDLEKKSN